MICDLVFKAVETCQKSGNMKIAISRTSPAQARIRLNRIVRCITRSVYWVACLARFKTRTKIILRPITVTNKMTARAEASPVLKNAKSNL